MKRMILAAAGMTALLATAGAANADGHFRDWDAHRFHAHPVHDRVRTRVYLDFGPLLYPRYYSPYYYTAPPQVIVTQPAPTTYVQPAPPPETENYWYYCTEPKGYYPYVKTCPPGWMKVVPQTPTQ